jgi:uncharacterized membrane protein
MKQRFILVAWPEDHEEDLAQAACDIQDVLDAAQVGGAVVICPLPAIVGNVIETNVKELP